MSRSSIAVVIAGMILLATAGVADAKSHGGEIPSDLSVWQTIECQLEDFTTHMSLTFQAIMVMRASPSLGLSMLNGALCDDNTHWAHALFDTADHARETLFWTPVILVCLVWMVTKGLIRITVFIARLIIRRPAQAPA